MDILKNRNFILFLLGSFLIPLASITAQTMISNDFICFVLYGIQAAAPTISAIIVLWLNKEVKIHFAQLFRKEYLKRAVILPFSIACMTMLLAKIVFCVLSERAFVLGYLSAVQWVIILWAVWAEEIGWRGYLEPLLKMHGVHRWAAPCMVGVIWCLWHYHFFLQRGMEVPVPLFLISCIIESYIYSFFMSLTRNNLVSAMTYHFAWNLFMHIAAVSPADNDGNLFPYIILAMLEAVVLCVFWSVRKMRVRRAAENLLL